MSSAHAPNRNRVVVRLFLFRYGSKKECVNKQHDRPRHQQAVGDVEIRPGIEHWYTFQAKQYPVAHVVFDFHRIVGLEPKPNSVVKVAQYPPEIRPKAKVSQRSQAARSGNSQIRIPTNAMIEKAANSRLWPLPIPKSAPGLVDV
jgi:hypothetical protein